MDNLKDKLYDISTKSYNDNANKALTKIFHYIDELLTNTASQGRYDAFYLVHQDYYDYINLIVKHYRKQGFGVFYYAKNNKIYFNWNIKKSLYQIVKEWFCKGN